ncbi:MAG: hypothetical protein KC609_17770 [Myxococcales bacterium]|nr:hypothetical protein [Myxococcales bacterium]
MNTFLFVILGIVAMFAIAFIWNRFVAKHPTLARLPMANGERILFDESGLRVFQRGHGRSTQFINSRLRVTDRRIIVAQKMLLGGDEALRYVFDYTSGDHDGTDLGTSLREGALFGSLTPDQLEAASDEAGSHIRLPLGGGALTRGQHAAIYTDRAAEIVARLQRDRPI